MYRHPCTVTFEEAVTRKRPIFYTDCYRFFFFFFLFDIRSHNTGNSDDLPYLDSIFYFQAFRDFFFHKLESHFSLLNFVDRNNFVKKISSKYLLATTLLESHVHGSSCSSVCRTVALGPRRRWTRCEKMNRAKSEFNGGGSRALLDPPRSGRE